MHVSTVTSYLSPNLCCATLLEIYSFIRAGRNPILCLGLLNFFWGLVSSLAPFEIKSLTVYLFAGGGCFCFGRFFVVTEAKSSARLDDVCRPSFLPQFLPVRCIGLALTCSEMWIEYTFCFDGVAYLFGFSVCDPGHATLLLLIGNVMVQIVGKPGGYDFIHTGIRM